MDKLIGIYNTSLKLILLYAQRLFLIYVSKNDEWVLRKEEDWDYISQMSRFLQHWMKKTFNLKMPVSADILPVIPGKLFDRMSVSYLARDHSSRGKSVYHFYLAYFKPFWTDCQTEGYSSDNFGMIYWERPKGLSSTNVGRIKFFAETNCVKISHLLSHEIMRMMGKSRKIYFDGVHELCEKHRRGKLPFLYFNDRFDLVSNTESYHFCTIDIKKMAT